MNAILGLSNPQSVTTLAESLTSIGYAVKSIVRADGLKKDTERAIIIFEDLVTWETLLNEVEQKGPPGTEHFPVSRTEIRSQLSTLLESLHDSLPTSLQRALLRATYVGEGWTAVEKTGSTRGQTDIWVAVSGHRTVLIVGSEVEEIPEPLQCETSRFGRDVFQADNTKVFKGHRLRSAPLRELAAQTARDPEDRLHEAAKAMLFEENLSSAAFLLSFLADHLACSSTSDEHASERQKAVQVLYHAAHSQSDEESSFPIPYRYAEDDRLVEHGWLHKTLEIDEMLLAWLETSSTLTIPSTGEEVSGRYLLTDQRSALVAVSDSGYSHVQHFDAHRLEVTDVTGKDTVTIGDVSFRTTLSNDVLYQDLAAASQVDGTERVFAVMHALWTTSVMKQTPLDNAGALSGTLRDAPRWTKSGGGHTESDKKHLLRLASHVLDDGSSSQKLIASYVLQVIAESSDTDLSTPEQKHLADALKRHAQHTKTAQSLTEMLSEWHLPPSGIQATWPVEGVSKEIENWPAWALPLYRVQHETALQQTDEDEEAILVDLDWALRLIDAGHTEEAIDLLETHLDNLPDETHEDLLPAPEEDLSEGEGGQLLHVAILDMLKEIQEDYKIPRTLQRLAELQPLRKDRLRELKCHAEPRLKEKTVHALQFLEGEESKKADVERSVSGTLRTEELEKIRHPATQDGGFMDSLKEMLAEQEEPDQSAIRSQCERITADAGTPLADALADATFVLGIPGLEVFVSRGKHSTGIRSLSDDPPSLLIGGDHLDPSSGVFLKEEPLRFVIGSEAAHIAFDHARITGRDVRQGIWNKLQGGVELALDFVPMLSKLPQIQKLSKNSATRKAIQGISKFAAQRDVHPSQGLSAFTSIVANKKETKAVLDILTSKKSIKNIKNIAIEDKNNSKRSTLSPDQRALLATSRVMQLTADRAGLLLCHSLESAIEAMIALDERYHGLPSLFQKYGLVEVLSRRDSNGNILHQNLAVRIASLISFYLSDTWDELVDRVYA